MKIAVLSRNTKLYSTKRLVETARARGHKVQALDPLRCYMRLGESNAIHCRGKELGKFDAAIPRIGHSVTFYATSILRQLEMMGVCVLNPSFSILKSRDKLMTMQLLSQAGIGIPNTVFGDNPDDTKDLMKMIGPPPHIIKLNEGTQGTGVVLATRRSSSRSVVEAFRGMSATFFVQEFVKDAKGADVRCFVVGDRVVAAMQRQAKNGEFRSNIHRGGTAQPTTLTVAESDTALKASKLLGLSVAGVDILRSSRGPLVLEVNSSPGLEGIEAATRIDVAGAIIEHLEHAVPQKHKSKGVRHATQEKENSL